MFSMLSNILPLYTIGAIQLSSPWSGYELPQHGGGAGIGISSQSDLPVYPPSGHPLVSVAHVYPGLDPQPIHPRG